MLNNIHFTSIKEAMVEILDHPLLQDVTIEQAVRYTLQFMNKVGYPQMYENKLADVEIEDHRGMLPCDCISIVQVMDGCSRETLKLMTDVFDSYAESIPAYKIQGRCIFTTFHDGKIKVAYRAIKTDKMGFPMIPDSPLFIEALGLYIKVKVFTYKFDEGKVPQGVLQNAKQDYAWAVGQLNSEMTLPNYDEMEIMTNMFNQLIPSVHLASDGFLHLGDHMNLPNRRRR